MPVLTIDQFLRDLPKQVDQQKNLSGLKETCGEVASKLIRELRRGLEKCYVYENDLRMITLDDGSQNCLQIKFYKTLSIILELQKLRDHCQKSDKEQVINVLCNLFFQCIERHRRKLEEKFSVHLRTIH